MFSCVFELFRCTFGVVKASRSSFLAGLDGAVRRLAGHHRALALEGDVGSFGERQARAFGFAAPAFEADYRLCERFGEGFGPLGVRKKGRDVVLKWCRGSIFEKKLLLARLLRPVGRAVGCGFARLGTTWRDVYALGRSPSEELLAALVKELALVAEASKNEAVDVVLLAAGRGRVAEVFRRMEATHAEALESLRRKARVTVAGGHVVGSEADLECLRGSVLQKKWLES